MKKRTSKDLDRAKGIQEQRAMRQPDNQTLFITAPYVKKAHITALQQPPQLPHAHPAIHPSSESAATAKKNKKALQQMRRG